MDMVGSPGRPIEISWNGASPSTADALGNAGIENVMPGSLTPHVLSYVDFIGNGEGVSWAGGAPQDAALNFDHCTFAFNRSNFRGGGIKNVSDIPALDTITACTFHDQQDNSTAPVEEAVVWGEGTDSCSRNLAITDSTISGAGDVAIRVSDVGPPVGGVVTITNSSIVISGPNAVAISTAGTSATQLITIAPSVINVDPQYVASTLSDYLAGDPRFLYVSGPIYQAAGAGGKNLAGSKRFVPRIGHTPLTITVDGNPTEWNADVPADSTNIQDRVGGGSGQFIYRDPVGDNTGGGSYVSPTNGAFANSSVDIHEVRVAHDGVNLYVLVTHGASGGGFGADAETQGAIVAINSVLGGPNNFLFQNAKMTAQDPLKWDSALILNETGSGLQAFKDNGTGGTTTPTGVAGAQNESSNAFEFRIPFSEIGASGITLPATIDLIVAMGHASGSNFRQVNTGSAGAFEGGGGAPGNTDADNARLYDLAGAVLLGQRDDYNKEGPSDFPSIRSSFLTIGLDSPAAAISGWQLF
ncbi:MAG: glucodextranase DOMON-like domain-containing protein, partial [bacterium]